MIPSTSHCLELMEKYAMRDNIRDHSIMVARVAQVLAMGLQDAGLDISMQKVTAGALLHDISKTHCILHGGDHAALGREICLENHLHEIADIVGEHVQLKDYHRDQAIAEKQIVYYADKRVNHDQIVSLEDRLQYLIERYGNDKAFLRRLIADNFELCKRVENKIFATLSFLPEDLAAAVAEMGHW